MSIIHRMVENLGWACLAVFGLVGLTIIVTFAIDYAIDRAIKTLRLSDVFVSFMWERLNQKRRAADAKLKAQEPPAGGKA